MGLIFIDYLYMCLFDKILFLGLRKGIEDKFLICRIINERQKMIIKKF